MREILRKRDLINLIFSPQPKTEDTKAPYLIRGHHLRFYHLLLNQYGRYGNESPEEMAGSHMKQWQKEQIRVKTESSQDPFLEEDVKYFKDFIGDTPEEHTIFRQRYQKSLKAFIDLPYDHPVEIVQKQDNMCKNCIIGDHCGLIEQANEDKLFLTIFQSESNRRRNNKAFAAEEFVDYSDKGTQKVTAILTDIGTVRKTLLHTPYNVWTLPRPTSSNP